MKSIMTLVFCLLSFQTARAAESFKVPVKTVLKRCVGHSPDRIVDCKESEKTGKSEEIAIELKDCGAQNTYGQNCSGRWTKRQELEGFKVEYAVTVQKFSSAKFRYLISTTICRVDAPENNCSTQSMYLKDDVLPLQVSASGPGVWKNDYRGGAGYDASVLYSSSIVLGNKVD